jgi:molybdenum cofactor guanylyltransferase
MATCRALARRPRHDAPTRDAPAVTNPVVTNPAVTGIVLAGGRARRFGGPKLEAVVDGEPLLARATRAVAAVADEVLVAGPALPGFAGITPRLVLDAQPFDGPLAALAGAIREARGTLAIVVGGDMPWLEPRVLELLLSRLAANPAADAAMLGATGEVAGEPSRRQVLPLAIRVASGASAAAQAIDAGDRSLVRFVDRLRSIEIPAPEWLAIDPDARTLRDVDRPEDLAQRGNELR